MVTPTTAGSVVLVSFPFSDLSESKLRPSVVLADAGRRDWIWCQITSKPYSDPKAVKIANDDFLTGALHITSYARPGKLFTANRRLMVKELGILKNEPFKRTIDLIVDLLLATLIP